MDNVTQGSWKTTALSALAGIPMIAQQLTNLLDGDPQTLMSPEMLVTGLGMLGFGWFSKDKNV